MKFIWNTLIYIFSHTLAAVIVNWYIIHASNLMSSKARMRKTKNNELVIFIYLLFLAFSAFDYLYKLLEQVLTGSLPKEIKHIESLLNNFSSETGRENHINAKAATSWTLPWNFWFWEAKTAAYCCRKSLPKASFELDWFHFAPRQLLLYKYGITLYASCFVNFCPSNSFLEKPNK